MKKILILAAFLLFPVFAFGQTDLSSKAVVYVYAFKQSSAGRIRTEVFINDELVAHIRPNRKFVLVLEPGKYDIHLKKSKGGGGASMDLKAGEIYYLRATWRVGFFIKPETLTPEPKEAGEYNIKGIMSVTEKDVKDKKRAFTDLPK